MNRLINPDEVPWEKLRAKNESYKQSLSYAQSERKDLIMFQLPKLYKARKQAREEYEEKRTVVENHQEQLEGLLIKVEYYKQKWEEFGYDRSKFYLCNEATKAMVQCEILRKVDLTEEMNEVEEALKELTRAEKACKSMLQEIRDLKIKYKNIQCLMNDNSSLFVVMDYQKSAHHCDAYCDVQRYQLSIKREKYYIANKIKYVMYDGEWYRMKKDNQTTEEDACGINEVRFIESAIESFENEKILGL